MGVKTKIYSVMTLAAVLLSGSAFADQDVRVPLNRSILLQSPEKLTEVAVADPNIADIVTHGTSKVSVLGKRVGRTSLRFFGEDAKLLREYEVEVTFDLPAVRKAISDFFPTEKVGAEVINGRLALVGSVSSADVAAKVVEVASQFIDSADQGTGVQAAAGLSGGDAGSKVLNMLKITSGQQVMLRVKMGEIQRGALKKLGTTIEAGTTTRKSSLFAGGERDLNIIENLYDNDPKTSPTFRGDTNTIQGSIIAGSFFLQAALEALENDGLFKMLAEPNLVAMSGEKAEFLAGGEFPIPIASENDKMTIEFKQYGVAVQFTPFVISDDRIRLVVQPEVSELSDSGSIKINSLTIPALSSRRAKTTVELAPGESLMIAGLMKDSVRSSVQDVPGLNEIPILGALMRNTSFNREESELVISVTPYIVDPIVSSDIKMPTDNFKPASVLETFFYGSLSNMSGDKLNKSQRPMLEGQLGFMTE